MSNSNFTFVGSNNFAMLLTAVTLIVKLRNTFSRTKFLTKLTLNKKLKENIKFFRKEKGKKCFIIGSGPSLKHTDLSIMDGSLKIGVNEAYRAHENLAFDYYLMAEPVYFTKNSQHIKNIKNSSKNVKFFGRYSSAKIHQPELLYEDDFYWFQSSHLQWGKRVEYDFTKGISGCMNIVCTAIQLAIYMGFEEINLVGCDYNSFCSPKLTHAYADEEEKLMSLGEELFWYSLTSHNHYALRKLSNDLNIRIVNRTPNSLLDAYQSAP